MVNPDLDEVIINLKVITSLQINTKLSTSGVFLNIEKQGYIPERFLRWYRNDSRDEAIKKIDRIVQKSLCFIKSNDIDAKDITHYLLKSKNGLMNLKETYSNCIQTTARLDTIIDKITSLEEKYNEQKSKIHIFETSKSVVIDSDIKSHINIFDACDASESLDTDI
jgi:hypothetical protein